MILLEILLLIIGCVISILTIYKKKISKKLSFKKTLSILYLVILSISLLLVFSRLINDRKTI